MQSKSLHPKHVKLADVTDDNGTSLLSYAQTFLEKVDGQKKHKIAAIVLTNIEPASLQIFTNVSLDSVPTILREMADVMDETKPLMHGEIKVNPPETQIN